jgi:hypothetical protein
MSRPARCRTLFSKPLAYPSTLDRRENGVLRGGALEPEPRILRRNWQANAHAYSQRNFTSRSTEGLSLSGGASIRNYCFFKLSITFSSTSFSPPKRRRRPAGSPSLRAAMPLVA